MSQQDVPPGWPGDVRPPGTPKHVRTAVNWLFDLCAADYRAHQVLNRRPRVLAWLALWHVEAQQRANVAARAAARAELGPRLDDARALSKILDVLDLEQARLLAVHRSVRLVAEALDHLPEVTGAREGGEGPR